MRNPDAPLCAPLHRSHRPATSGPSRSADLRVVVADDALAVRRSLVALLSSIDHVRIVGEAGDTRQTIELVETLHPDVLVLDISMPGGNGIQALEHIRQTNPDTFVIMLTNHSDGVYRRRCLSSGADCFFDKSRDFEQVGDVLARLAHRGASGRA